MNIFDEEEARNIAAGRTANGSPMSPDKPRDADREDDRRSRKISTLEDLADWLGCDDTSVARLNRSIYKGTDCGASISIYGTMQDDVGTHWHALHNGYRDPYPAGFKAQAFTIQTIVEGSDATVDSDSFTLGEVTVGDVEDWVDYMEGEATRLWDEANGDEPGEDDDAVACGGGEDEP